MYQQIREFLFSLKIGKEYSDCFNNFNRENYGKNKKR